MNIHCYSINEEEELKEWNNLRKGKVHLPIVDEYTYLGIVVTKGNIPLRNIEERIAAATSVFNTVKATGFLTKSIMPLETRLGLILSNVRAKVLSGMEALKISGQSETLLSEFSKECFKTLVCTRSTSATVSPILVATGQVEFHVMLHYLTVNLLLRILNVDIRIAKTLRQLASGEIESKTSWVRHVNHILLSYGIKGPAELYKNKSFDKFNSCLSSLTHYSQLVKHTLCDN